VSQRSILPDSGWVASYSEVALALATELPQELGRDFQRAHLIEFGVLSRSGAPKFDGSIAGEVETG
jgi:hypothetical protein